MQLKVLFTILIVLFSDWALEDGRVGWKDRPGLSSGSHGCYNSRWLGQAGSLQFIHMHAVLWPFQTCPRMGRSVTVVRVV